MMLTYVTLLAPDVRLTPAGPRRDKVAAALLGGRLRAIVCTPSDTIGRVGILLLGSHALFVVGVILLVLGLALQAGETGAVRVIEMGAKLAAGNASHPAARSRAAAGGA